MTRRLNEITWQDDELTRWIGEMRRGRDGINLWRDEMKILSRIWRHSLHPHFPPRGLIRYCTRVLRFRAGSNFAKKNKRLLAVYHLNKLKAMSEIFIRKWVLAIQRSERWFSHVKTMIRPVKIANDVFSRVRKMTRPIRSHRGARVSRQNSDSTRKVFLKEFFS